MKTFIILTLTSILFCMPALAQFPYGLMPGHVFDTMDDDTLLNKRTDLQKAGIRKIYAYQPISEKLKTYKSKTILLNERGKTESITLCFPKKEPVIESWCTSDTFLYDDRNRLKEMKFRDAKGNGNLEIIYEYIGESELKFVSIAKIQNKQWDTLVDHRYFNKKGQMVKLIQIRKGQPVTSSLYYYNADGLLDSVHYENSSLPTFVYKRSEKGKKKLIEAQILNSKFTWTFNQSGQWLSMEAVTIYPPRSNYTSVRKTETNYYYNPDGTLSKVTLKGTDTKKTTMYYTYSK